MTSTFQRTFHSAHVGISFVIRFPRKEIFARRRCEDLLIPFSCTSTDIVQFEEKALRVDGCRVNHAKGAYVCKAVTLPNGLLDIAFELSNGSFESVRESDRYTVTGHFGA